jgi:hypothetical protein
MSEKLDVEMHIRVFDQRGNFVAVRPDSDGLGLLEVDGKDDFGRIIMTVEMALEVAAAIHRVAADMRPAKPTGE